MFVKIPFEKEIAFKTSIYEITKMSLEHDFNLNNDTILGNFYLSGEYRAHEVSVNTESFEYTLPFSVLCTEDIKEDSLELNIEDFSYEIIDNKNLKVNIDYTVKAEALEKIFQSVDETEIKEELEEIDNFLAKEDDYRSNITKEDSITINEEKTIMDTIKDSDDTFVTYHIHVMKENETIESICTLYNVSSNLISEYNNIDTIGINDKIIIPKIDE